MSCVDDAQFNV